MSARQFQAKGEVVQRFLGAAALGFYIPVYQRDYSWGQEDIQRLFDDLDDAARDFVEGEDDRLTFLGSVIVTSGSPPRGSQKPTAVFHVVDGQQRITTLVMIAARLHLELEEVYDALKGSESRMSGLTQRTAAQLRDLCVIDSKSRDEPYWPRLIRVDDRWSFESRTSRFESDIARIIAVEVLNKRLDTPNERSMLMKAWRVIDSIIGAYRRGDADGFIGALPTNHVSDQGPSVRLDEIGGYKPATDDEWAATRLLLIAKSLLERVQLIVVEAPDEERAFSIFEPLNTTGQLLTALETIKPKIVKIEGGQDTYVDSESRKLLREIEETVATSSPAKKAKESADLVTVFSLAEEGEKIGHKLSTQRRVLDRMIGKEDSPDDVRSALKHLRDVAKFRKEVWSDPKLGPVAAYDDDETWVALAFLKESNHNIPRALLSRYYWAQQRHDIQREEWRRLVRAVAAFWFLWRASRSTTAGIDSHYRTLMAAGWGPSSCEGSAQGTTSLPPLARGKTVGPLPPVDDVLAAFRSILTQRGGIADGKVWVESTTRIGVYGGRAIQKFGLLIAHHDVRVHDVRPHLMDGVPNSSPVLGRRYWAGLRLTIEHIAPRSPRHGDDSFDRDIHAQKRLKDGWGNLTLVPQMENTVLSNRSWPEKREIYGILGSDDISSRVRALEEMDISLGKATKERLKAAGHMPFCSSLALWEGGRWTREMVETRSEALAQRMWEWCADLLNWNA